MWAKRVFSALGVAATVLVAGCSYKVDINGQVADPSLAPTPDYTGIRQSVGTDWYEMSQGWNAALRRAYWFTPQGSALVPYDWFLALEMPERSCKGQPDPALNKGNWTYFKDPAHLSSLGYIPAPKDPLWNPDGLPIGFAKTPTADGDFMGPTCAACHSNMIHLKKAGSNRGFDVLIEGAPTLADLQGLNVGLADALCSMIPGKVSDKNDPNFDEEKHRQAASRQFDRFAERVLEPGYSQKDKDELMDRLERFTQAVQQRNAINYAALKEDYGKGRLDAVGAILNEVATTKAGVPSNYHPANAPVSYPFLWGTPQADVVQWNGFVENTNILFPPIKLGLGALGRNVGEVVGVYGHVVIDPVEEGAAYQKSLTKELLAKLAPNLIQKIKGPQFGGFESSVMMANLGSIEHWVGRLKPPQWPADVLGTPDAELVAWGRAIYEGKKYKDKDETDARCFECHEVVERADVLNPYRSEMIPQSKIKTDDTFIANFLRGENLKGEPYETGKFEGMRKTPFGSERYQETFANRGEALSTVVMNIIVGKAFNDGIKGLWRSSSDAPSPETEQNLKAYKARPLNGIWATAPYLHNGSVPSIWELLTPEGERIDEFCVGSRVFDPAKIGYEYEPVEKAGTKTCPEDRYHQSLLKTSVTGNDNGGHSTPAQGVNLDKNEKKALIEFLKTL